MNPSREFLKVVIAALVALLLPGAAAFAQSSPSATPRVVLKGYDAVAYFTEKRPVQGSPQISYDWDGERYLFSSTANRARFAANPDRYAPQFGGYCTGSMSAKRQLEADPEAWIVLDGKLYVFGQVKFAEIARNDPKWLADRIPLAAVNWQGIKTK